MVVLGTAFLGLGGVWKNTEDEILKAAVMKYGKNQWGRISSLLVRKSAKQCKARWYEWLDPSIKKTEWSKEEDEKLLHLAKLMPTQWRTIAPIVGRTPAQCLERYQRLLDEAEHAEAEEQRRGPRSSQLGLAGPQGGEGAPSVDTSHRRLRPGQIDPDPETKPARPDPIDMDDDEKEMLSEARARLANTQGKKAKRKARERQLEEARRLATLQKRRELKAAGIEQKQRRKKYGIDYNADIPFEKKPMAGFYDATDELARANDLDLLKKRLNQIEGRKKRDQDEDQDERKSKYKRAKKGADGSKVVSFIPARDAQLAKLQEVEEISQRIKLSLPAPQVTEAELEEIVKLGAAGETVRDLVATQAAGPAPSDMLMSDYDAMQTQQPVRTPRTPATENTILNEARNLRRRTETQTPLLARDEDVLPESGTGYDGITPRRSVAQTPNPLLTPLRELPPNTQPGGSNQATPRVAHTPLRDELSINQTGNTPLPMGTPGEFSVASTPQSQAFLSPAEVKLQVARSLQALPAPKNEFEIVLPEDASEQVTDSADAMVIEEDAGDRDHRLQALAEQEYQRALKRRSQVVQQQLPRPRQLTPLESLMVGDPDVTHAYADARQLISHEMVALLTHDVLKYPVPGAKPLANISDADELLTPLADAELDQARQLVIDELAIQHPTDMLETMAAQLAKLSTADPLSFESTSSGASLNLSALSVLDPATHRSVPLTHLSADQQCQHLKRLFERYRERMVKESQRAAKLEKKLSVTMGGYQAKAAQLSDTLVTSVEAQRQKALDQQCFEVLAQTETKVALPSRLEYIQSIVDRAKRHENELQSRYKALAEQRESAIARIQGLMDSQANGQSTGTSP
ncbi:Pre-mRNA-splicing factor cef1 [Dimargaris verticillata]|uniref:Pre-mRNA-splicing factor cef1 n=1 Tax=Dimargaris verticillata TaxID=2761393 RepID=A0A9W8B6U4_9FUNG|nr:Pre-mRNA-splicing factor cef1 [Dimargaris verticillata]